MKRSHDNYSSSESDLDDNVEVEKDSGDENGQLDSHGSMSPSTTTQVQARKRRRGIIEKRRRDRINNSLTELRRLVPSAFEKQGSAKLEKAEILQMTVDHLKMLHASGGKGFFEAHALAKDYRSLGFRECLAETVRYLSLAEVREGPAASPSADPLRVRLVSHLSSYASQREVHSGLEQHHQQHHHQHLATWGSAYAHLHHHHHHHQQQHHLPHHILQHPHHHALLLQGRTKTHRSNSPSSSSSSSSSTSSSSSSSPTSSSERSGASRVNVAPAVESLRVTPKSASLTLSLPMPASKLSPPPLMSSLSSLSFPLSLGAVFPLVSPVSSLGTLCPSSSLSSSTSSSSSSSALSKPYRPWGTEIGAF